MHKRAFFPAMNSGERICTYNLDEEKIECALGNKELCFWQGKKAKNVVFLYLMLELIFL